MLSTKAFNTFKTFGTRDIYEEQFASTFLLDDANLKLYHYFYSNGGFDINLTKNKRLTKNHTDLIEKGVSFYGLDEKKIDIDIRTLLLTPPEFIGMYEGPKNILKRHWFTIDNIPQFIADEKIDTTVAIDTVKEPDSMYRINSNIINDIRRQIPFKIIQFKKPLFHGTTRFFVNPEHVPFKFTNWFSTDINQSEFHIIDEVANRDWDNVAKPIQDRYLYIYGYILKRPLNLIQIDDLNSFRDVLKQFNLNIRAFSADDYLLASVLCSCNINNLVSAKCGLGSMIDGWYFPNDQQQVMLCHAKNIPGVNENSLLTKLQFKSLYYYSPDKHGRVIPLDIPDTFEDRVEYFKDYFRPYYKDNDRLVKWNPKSYVIETFRDYLSALYDTKSEEKNTLEEKNKVLDDIDTQNKNFVLGMITNAIKPYIYHSIYMLNRELQDLGIVVISGGEAINHHLIENKREFTPDIDTKLIILGRNIQGFDEVFIRNRIWEAMKLVISYLDSKYSEMYHNMLLPLSNTFAFETLGVIFHHPSELKINGGELPHIFLRRFVLSEKEISNYTVTQSHGRLFDIHLFSLDMILKHFYNLTDDTYIQKGGIEFSRDISNFNLKKDNVTASIKSKVDSIFKNIKNDGKKTDDDSDLTYQQKIQYIKDIYSDPIQQFKTIKNMSSQWYSNDNFVLAGLLDVPVMKTGELGDLLSTKTPDGWYPYICKSTCTDFAKYDVLVVSKEYLIKDIKQMTELGLRKAKAEKDKKRMQSLNQTPINLSILSDQEVFHLYNNNIFRYTKICKSLTKKDSDGEDFQDIDELLKIDAEYTNLNQSISKILYLTFPPVVEDNVLNMYQSNGIPYYDINEKVIPDPVSKQLAKQLTVDICFDYVNKQWINNCAKDTFANNFIFRYLRDNISTNTNFRENIIWSLAKFLEEIDNELSSLVDIRNKNRYTATPYIQGKVFSNTLRNCDIERKANIPISDRKCYYVFESLSRMLYSTPIINVSGGKMASITDKNVYNQYVLDFLNKYGARILNERMFCKKDIKGVNVLASFMFYKEIVDNIIIMLIPLYRKDPVTFPNYRFILNILYSIRVDLSKYTLEDNRTTFTYDYRFF